MDRPDILYPGTWLEKGGREFLVSLENTFFAGMVRGNFGVFAGTPDAPLGTSIILCQGVEQLKMDNQSDSLECISGARVVWATPQTYFAKGFCVMQSDGNLCVYQGTPEAQGKLLFGSKQCGALSDHFLPYPPPWPTSG